MIVIGCVLAGLSLSKPEQTNPFWGDGIEHKM